MARAAHLSSLPHHPPARMKGRGARSNTSSRYDAFKKEPDEAAICEEEEAFGPRTMRTDITLERPRHIINMVDSPYVPFDRSINPYRGCEHGCTYCFARPTHAYYGLSPGLDFETRLFAKPNAAALLEKELNRPRYQPRPIAIGTNTDPYQPIEKRLRIMRAILETLDRFSHPVSILTKSSLVTRDIDLIEPMGARNLAKAMISITTLDRSLARAMEPRASAPAQRLEAVRKLADAGCIVGVMTAPMIPGLNDDEMESILEAAKDAGAQFAGFTIIRLPQEVSDIFRQWLEATYPDRAARVMRHIREMNGGRDYDPKWSRAPQPRSVFAKLIAERFDKATRRLGFGEKPRALDCSQFQRPLDSGGQLSLFTDSSSR